MDRNLLFLNNLFHKILGKFKTENVSRQDLARELRGILEESIADIKRVKS